MYHLFLIIASFIILSSEISLSLVAVQGFQTTSHQQSNIAKKIPCWDTKNKATSRSSSSSSCLYSSQQQSIETPAKGFGKVHKKPTTTTTTTTSHSPQSIDPMTMKAEDVKRLLLDLLPSMTGTPEEFRLVETYVNALEEKYVPPQTLDFLNLAMAGEWQFLFTTNQLGRPSPFLRMTELVQNVQVDGLNGMVVNQAIWNLAQQDDEVISPTSLTFDVHGIFQSKISYNINQGARMTMKEDHDLTIQLGKGSKVPKDPQGLMGLIHRAMPTEMFDSSNLAMDTTYLDTDIRIVRFTGSRHEGVRNIFMRKGVMEINPKL
jgi:PAP_fibrillin.